jgi:Spy/CpxP family protein refolding chaperone
MKISCVKKAAMFLAVLAFSCAMVFAEPPPPCPGSPPPDSNLPMCEGKRPDVPFSPPWFMQEFSEKLNLTDAQKTALEQIVANEAKEIQAIRENSKKQIDAILTPEQQKELAEIKKGTHPRMRMRGFAGDRLEMLAEKLNLTEAQTAAIKPIFAAEANDIKTVWQDNSLSKEQKQSKMSDIREAAKEKINKILTPEQQAQLAELKAPAGRMHHKGMRPGPGQEPWEQPPPPPPPDNQEPADSNS